MNLPNFAIISACDQNYGIGINNRLPWRLPSELKYFQQITKNSTVIMGRNTWDSLPSQSKPLSNRQNIVVSTNPNLNLSDGVILADSIQDALLKASMPNIFVIGGARLYAEAIQHMLCNKVFLTKIESVFECDTFFPKDILHENFTLSSKSEKQTENGHSFYFEIYTKKV